MHRNDRKKRRTVSFGRLPALQAQRNKIGCGDRSLGALLNIQCKIDAWISLPRKCARQRAWRSADTHGKGRKVLFSLFQIVEEACHADSVAK